MNASDFVSICVLMLVGFFLFLSFPVRLDLGNNPLSSTIPNEIGNLVHLRQLFLAASNLSGSLPESLKTLKQLDVVSLWRTNLEGPIFDFVLKIGVKSTV